MRFPTWLASQWGPINVVKTWPTKRNQSASNLPGSTRHCETCSPVMSKGSVGFLVRSRTRIITGRLCTTATSTAQSASKLLNMRA